MIEDQQSPVVTPVDVRVSLQRENDVRSSPITLADDDGAVVSAISIDWQDSQPPRMVRILIFFGALQCR